MNSENVKKIKRVLEEEPFNTIKHHKKEGGWIVLSFQYILNYINELESDNESCHEVLADLKTIIKQQNDRIAELKKENADSLKQFAEKLIKRITDNDGKPIASLTVKGIKTVLKEEYGIGEDYKKEIFALKTTLEDREHEVRELNKKVERLEQSLSDCAFMTSSIGNLPMNSIGLRRAVDEIARLQTVEAELQELNAKYYNEAKDSRRKIKILKEEIVRLKIQLEQANYSIGE